MGYSGLSSWMDSDEASDFRLTIADSLNKLVKKELKNRANEFNTNGIVNISLLIEGKTFDANLLDEKNRENLLLGLQKMIKEASAKNNNWDEGNRLFHLNAYKRLLKSVNKNITDNN